MFKHKIASGDQVPRLLFSAYDALTVMSPLSSLIFGVDGNYAPLHCQP